MRPDRHEVVLRTDGLDAVIFDMDGVITDTATLHAAAWKEVFDDFLRSWSARAGAIQRPFGPDDYRLHVDGKPRLDGVRAFLASRGILLTEGNPDDPVDGETVHAIAHRKDARFREHVQEGGVSAYPSSVALVRELRERQVRVGVISASRNLRLVLDAAALGDCFDARVDGVEAERLHLRGKPDPAVFLEAARRLGASPERTIVVEDALAGVEAARRGGFALVVGVDRTHHPEDLLASGADVAVPDLADVHLALPQPHAVGAVVVDLEPLDAGGRAMEPLRRRLVALVRLGVDVALLGDRALPAA
ncbi:MAG: HAD family hydrolase, partial [Candidatus Limnocylindria bacterium]